VPLTIALSIALAASSHTLSTASSISPKETLIKLNVSPLAAPKPALRYLLLPELKEMTPGNPIPVYLQCMLDQDFSTQNDILPRSAFHHADRAARMDKPDWQIMPKSKSDGFSLLIPDVSKMRLISLRLRERFHDEVARGQIDDALGTAKTMFALSRHLSEHPTFMGNYMGLACAHLSLAQLEELLELRDCPNLYWALTNLPRPLIYLDRGIDGERLMFQSGLSNLDDKAPMTPAQVKKMIAQIDRSFGFNFKVAKYRTQPWLDARKAEPGLLAAARARLIECGIPEEQLLKFPAEQLLLLDEKWRYELRRDEVMKLMNVPLWQAQESMAKLEDAILKEEVNYKHLFTLSDSVLDWTKITRGTQGRVEQRIALLRHVEAIRLYAADHQGQLPTKLGDITVPLPDDPFTGKPFRYSLEGTAAHLRGSPPPGSENEAIFNLHYEITIRKPG
jgi:hypothetical protein